MLPIIADNNKSLGEVVLLNYYGADFRSGIIIKEVEYQDYIRYWSPRTDLIMDEDSHHWKYYLVFPTQ